MVVVPAAVKIFFFLQWPLLIGVMLTLLFMHVGCGIKGPPVPPNQPSVPVVKDLTYRIDDQTVTLSWQLTAPLSSKQARNAVFGVYRSLSSLSETACDNCPVVFEKLDEVPYTDVRSGSFSINVPLVSGYRYLFKVRLEMDGSSGPDSNTVRFDYSSDLPADQEETP